MSADDVNPPVGEDETEPEFGPNRPCCDGPDDEQEDDHAE